MSLSTAGYYSLPRQRQAFSLHPTFSGGRAGFAPTVSSAQR